MSSSNCLAPGAHLAGRHGFLVFHIQAVSNAGCCLSGQLENRTLDAVSWSKRELAPVQDVGGWDALEQKGDCSVLRPKASSGITIPWIGHQEGFWDRTVSGVPVLS